MENEKTYSFCKQLFYDVSDRKGGYMNKGVSFFDLFDLKEIQNIQDSFAKATGVASIITDTEGLPITGPSNFCRLCIDIIRKTEKGLINCMKSDAQIGCYNSEGPIVQPCLSGGLWDAGASIRVGDKHIANWLIGQVRNEAQNAEEMMRYAREIGADENEFRSALEEVTVMPLEQFQEVANALFLMANLMSRIAFQNMRLKDLTENLEEKVEEKTLELSQALEHLKKTQNQLIQSEKMAALGQLIAGVAHEINTPLGAVRSSVMNISKILDQTLNTMPGFFRQLPDEYHNPFFGLIEKSLRKDTNASSKEERRFRRSLVSSMDGHGLKDTDTIADILVDMGIYDDIEPFLPLLGNNESLSILQMAYKLSGLRRSTQIIGTATDRASKVVFALKSFARFDSSGKPIRADIAEGIETVLTLYHNQIKTGVEVIRNYEELPPVLCYPDELNQVWTNLIHNALQAMENKGKLTISLYRKDDSVVADITDSGKGIPDEIMDRIFEPFFTTKPSGEGSGLGLDIVKKIIAKHHGEITAESRPGKTTFSVRIPVTQKGE